MSTTSEYLVYGIGLSLAAISTICSIITVIKITYKWKLSGSFPMSLRFPLYIAIIDLLMYTTIYINQLKNAITGSNWEGGMCSAIATLFGFTVYLNMALFAAVMVQLYANIVLNVMIDFGKRDWKLFVFVCLVAGGIALCSIPSTGQDPYWCFDRMNTNDKTIEILALCISAILFNTICFCGFQVYLTIKNPDFSKRAKSKLDQITELTIWKMLTFAIVYVLEWTPQLPVMLLGIFNYYPDWIYVLSNLGLGAGGMLNYLGFLSNERLKEKISSNSARIIEANNPATVAVPIHNIS